MDEKGRSIRGPPSCELGFCHPPPRPLRPFCTHLRLEGVPPANHKHKGWNRQMWLGSSLCLLLAV